VADLSARFEKGDIVVDGGNSYYIDDIRRAEALNAKGMHYVDSGTSGGVWGLDRGFCQMIGGEKEIVKHLDPIFSTLAPSIDSAPRTPGREKVKGGTAEHGYLHCGPNGGGHFVKMVHNGIEYGIMAAYAEGMNILRNANAGKETHVADAETTPLRNPKLYQYDCNLTDIVEVWRRGSVIASWLLDLTAKALLDDPELKNFRRPGVRFGRGAMDDLCGDRRGSAGARAHSGALRTLQFARRSRVRRQAALRDALRVRRSFGKEGLRRARNRTAISPAYRAG
jgi:6-phosphogluconate dehydrogenase